ncbi:hypothetical protein BJ165DRAFT_1610637 [Panaeolus papilionaceus]|nr:hypothetical protein BJ165DRAFT_1610637 [Panaeolus papilionaceus]
MFHHASLLEFLLNPQRSEEFYVDIPYFDNELYKTALKHVGDLDSDAKEEYIVYCFLILLQTQTSLQPRYRERIFQHFRCGTAWMTSCCMSSSKVSCCWKYGGGQDRRLALLRRKIVLHPNLNLKYFIVFLAHLRGQQVPFV